MLRDGFVGACWWPSKLAFHLEVIRETKCLLTFAILTSGKE